MKIEIGQRFDFEIDREDVENVESGSIIATWFHMGNQIYVELMVSKTLVKEIKGFFKANRNRSALISIARISKSKYIVSPTVVLVNKQLKDIKQVK